MPAAIPAPLPNWAKTLVQLLPLVSGYLYDILTYHGQQQETDTWRHCAIHFKDIASGANPADDCYMGIDLVNITGGDIDSSWTSGDYSTCETALDTCMTAMKPYLAPTLQVSEYRWYKRAFNPMTETKPFQDSGPPDRVTSKAIVGTSSAYLPRQVACTITEKTAWPKHWGRGYFPFGSGASLTTSGRIATGTVDIIQGAWQTLYNSLATAEFQPVVPVTQVHKDPVRGLLQVTQVQVDDVPDVVRRRRLRNPSYRKVGP